MDRSLDPTYADARHRFVEAATRVGATLAATPHPLPGHRGEELFVDVASLGDPAAKSILMIVSGTHGVEGYAGSALQSWWLDNRADDIPAGLRVELIHGLNPYGFSWVRRVNEDHVDLNRNFVAWPTTPTNDGYREIADLLVPATWDETSQQDTTNRLLELAGEIGFEKFQEIISGGQYDYPGGVFYGGTGPVWSHRWLSAHLGAAASAVERLAIIDLHTGLGPWGHGELISPSTPGSPTYARETAWWGEVKSMQAGDSVSARLSGDWLAALETIAPGPEITAVALEFGTVDPITVLQALRADAWLFAHGNPTGPQGDLVRARVRAAFADDDPAWLAALIPRFDTVARGAMAGSIAS